MAQQVAAAIKHREQIIELAATGAKLSDIASRFGVTAARISEHLSKDPEYQAAREIAAELRLEEREAKLESAPALMAEISRASQLLSQQRWRCEREFPKRWGAKQQVELNGAVNVEHVVALKADSLLESIRATQQCEVIEGESKKYDVSD